MEKRKDKQRRLYIKEEIERIFRRQAKKEEEEKKKKEN